MDEFEFIRSISQGNYHQSSLIKGIGDDAAVFRQPYKDIVTAVDTFVEGVHFTKNTMDAYYVGYRALAANISDVAAMGAFPAMCLVSITLPKTWDTEEPLSVMAGIKDMAKQYNIDIIGGDTVSADTFVLSITIIGYIAQEKSRYRSTALPNDVIFVTGTLGDAAAGLSILLENGKKAEWMNYFIDRHRMPQPRIAFTQAITSLDRVTLNDVSDGIANEASEIAEASGVDFQLYDRAIPVAANYELFPTHKQFDWKYFGGEDFEILGTVPAADWDTVREIAKEIGIRVTDIGHVLSGKGQVYIEQNGNNSLLPKRGYEHKE